MGDKSYNFLEGELIDNLNSALMTFVMDDAFDLITPKQVAEKLIEKLLGTRPLKPRSEGSYESLLSEYKDHENFGDFA